MNLLFYILLFFITNNQIVCFVASSDINEIIPHVYLGNYVPAQNCLLLKEYKITSILNVAIEISDAFCPIEHVYLPLYDNLEQNLFYIFPKIVTWINQTINLQQNIFIHCAAGKSRSVALLMAYLVFKYNINCYEALYLIKQKRPEINPNFSFLNQVCVWERYLSTIKK